MSKIFPVKATVPDNTAEPWTDTLVEGEEEKFNKVNDTTEWNFLRSL